MMGGGKIVEHMYANKTKLFSEKGKQVSKGQLNEADD